MSCTVITVHTLIYMDGGEILQGIECTYTWVLCVLKGERIQDDERFTFRKYQPCC